MSMIREVELDQVKEGTILARDLKDGNGAHLLSARAVLSRAVLEKLKERGIDSVFIAQENLFSEKEASERRQELEQQLTHLFRKVGNEPLMQELKQTLLSHRCRGL